MLSEDAKEVASFLINALKDNKIEKRFSFFVINDRNNPTHTKPVMGIRDSTFRVPISALSSLWELKDNGLIDLTVEHRTGVELWQVRLKNNFDGSIKSRHEESKAVSPRIFISYSSQDSRLKDQILTGLQKTYSGIWSDREFQGGEKIWNHILPQIANCDIFVYLLSPDSIISFACRVEYAEAVRWGKQIIPVMIRDANIPNYIKTENNYINAASVSDEEVITSIGTAITKVATRIASMPPDPLWQKPIKRSVETSRLEVSVKVSARIEPKIEQQEQLNTGVILLPKDTITISATGLITNDISNGIPRTWIGPNGIDQHNRCNKERHAYRPDYCIGSLFGWISKVDEYGLTNSFWVGENYSQLLTMDSRAGFLYLAVNDSIQQYDDNDKEFTATIVVTRS